MTDTLAQLIDKLQALLLDDGTRFTDATCTAAIRQALKEYNLSAPQYAGDLVTAEEGHKEYELEDGTAIEIMDVLRQGKDAYTEDHTPLNFDAYFEDARPFFRLHSAEPVGNTIIVRYTCPHIISGLDGETESTLPALQDALLLDGAAWQACLIRAMGRIELINLNDEVADPWREMGERFKETFQAGLEKLSRMKPARVRDTRAWAQETNKF